MAREVTYLPRVTQLERAIQESKLALVDFRCPLFLAHQPGLAQMVERDRFVQRHCEEGVKNDGGMG